MSSEWQQDVDAALAEAKNSGKPLLLDFTAAPM
jgi:thiol:disulfide interchange protein